MDPSPLAVTGLALWLTLLEVKLPPAVEVQLTAKVAPVAPSPVKATCTPPLLTWNTRTAGAFGAAPAGAVSSTSAVALNATRLVNSATGFCILRFMVPLRLAATTNY